MNWYEQIAQLVEQQQYANSIPTSCSMALSLFQGCLENPRRFYTRTKELSKFYLNELKTYRHEYVSTEVIENCKKSLTNIINS